MTEPVAAVALQPAMLRDLIREAAAVPVHAMKEMQRELIEAQGIFTHQQLEVQKLLVEKLGAPQSETDPLRKLREKDPSSLHSQGRVITS